MATGIENNDMDEDVGALNRFETKELILFSALAGRVMLENGAETYRAEETVERILTSRGIARTHSFVIPTAIFISIEYEDELYSHSERIKNIGIDLMRITRVNELSREFVESGMSIEMAKEKLNAIKQSSQYGIKTRILFAGVAGSFIALLFKGGWVEFGGAFIASLITAYVLEHLSLAGASLFARNLIGGATAATASILFGIVFTSLNLAPDLDIIIIGSIMTMVPGVAITNAVRDSISGDYVSGLSRSSEALVIAVAMAFGVGLVLNGAGLLLGRLMP
jgi:uncharacterized membrane protein YjjP (DUF1212 family)